MTLILLPPSEGNTGRRRDRPVDLGALSFPALTGRVSLPGWGIVEV
jgi:hypothetical protein